MLFERIESEGLSHYSYLIGSDNSAAVIDPRRDCAIYAEKAAEAGMRIEYILETHRNEDYVIGSLELASVTGAEIWHADSQLTYRYGRAVSDGQEWAVGPHRIRAILAPGHTKGMMSYLLHDDHGAPWILFSGDALFAGEVGRVDFEGKNRLREMAGLLYDTLFRKFLPLGDGIILCPAHGSGSICGSAISGRTWTTIGLERRLSPKLSLTEPLAFVEATAKDLEKAPYFEEMERINVEGAPLLGRLPILNSLSPGEFKERIGDSIVVDTRAPDAFAGGHIKKAISIWRDGLPGFAGWFLPYDKPLLLVTDEGDEEKIVRYLVRMGYDSFGGRLAGGMLSWYKAGEETATNGRLTAQEVCGILDSGRPSLFLDVRSEEELEEEGRFAKALHIHITQLPHRMNELPTDRPIYIFCASGLRSTIAASLLQRHGVGDVHVVLGGFTGWSSVTCPLEMP
jgi:hydroxyacylglutathione hydrolase